MSARDTRARFGLCTYTQWARWYLYTKMARDKEARRVTHAKMMKKKKKRKKGNATRYNGNCHALLANYTERRISDERSEQSQRCYGNMLNFIYKSHIILFLFSAFLFVQVTISWYSKMLRSNNRSYSLSPWKIWLDCTVRAMAYRKTVSSKQIDQLQSRLFSLWSKNNRS